MGTAPVSPPPVQKIWEEYMRAASPEGALHLRQLAQAKVTADLPGNQFGWAALAAISDRVLRERKIDA